VSPALTSEPSITTPNRASSQQKPSTSTLAARPRSSPTSSRRRPAGSRLSQSVVSKLEDLDLESDPLGPLGEDGGGETVAPPPPPAKDDSPLSRAAKQPATTFSEIKAEIDTPRYVDPVRTQQPPPVARQLSTPLEQAAQPPTFHITVGDPTTIGNITGSHTEYKVRTKTNSKAFKSEEFTVNRRYRDFVWLYTALNNNNPGIVVPPPPEKQQLGNLSACKLRQVGFKTNL
jgi:sorting nexin-1/2